MRSKRRLVQRGLARNPPDEAVDIGEGSSSPDPQTNPAALLPPIVSAVSMLREVLEGRVGGNSGGELREIADFVR